LKVFRETTGRCTEGTKVEKKTDKVGIKEINDHEKKKKQRKAMEIMLLTARNSTVQREALYSYDR
jgi:hypothetical protein